MEINDEVLWNNFMDIYSEKSSMFHESKCAIGKINAESKNGTFIANIKFKLIDKFWISLVHDAIMYLKARDRSDSLKTKDLDRKNLISPAFGIKELVDYFKSFKEFENVLYGADGYYRGHYVHVIRVWLIGMVILKENLKGSVAELKHYSKSKGFVFDKHETMAIWTLTALCHDLGYPLSHFSKIDKSLSDIYSHFGKNNYGGMVYSSPITHQFINDFILKFISSKVVPVCTGRSLKNCEKVGRGACYKTQIQPKYYLKFSKSLENSEHGIISCIIMMKKLVYFLESDFDLNEIKTLKKKEAKQFVIRSVILRAIATHTCLDIYHLDPATLSFLLFISDELQTYDRPTLKEMISGDSEIELESELVEFRKKAGSWKIGIVFKEMEKDGKNKRGGGEKKDEGKDGSEDSSREKRIKNIFNKYAKILRSGEEIDEFCKYIEEYREEQRRPKYKDGK